MQIINNYRCPNCFYEYDYFAWEESLLIESMTNFEDIWDFSCPVCGTPKDEFNHIEEYVNEVEDLDNMLFEEEMHVPFYKFENGNLIISAWIDDNFHPMDEEHYLKYVWLFNDEWDMMAYKSHSNIGNTEEIVFKESEIASLDFGEIRVACNVHGIWRRKIENS